MAKVLLCDDNQDILSALKALLSARGYEVCLATNPNDAITSLQQENIDIALVDLNYTRDTTSGEEGLSLIAQMHQLNAQLPIVVMTAFGNMQLAIKTLQSGARDFIEKPWDNDRLLSIIRTQLDLGKALADGKRLAEENQQLKAAQAGSKAKFVSTSMAMKSVNTLIERIATTPANILITGEHGSGKGVTAEQIYQLSDRADKPLVTVNIGAISDTLFESELFGHVKGAFTDAKQSRQGRFELADGGTLFLDEIGNLSLPMQAKLLRVIESGEFEPVGSSKTIRVNVRLLSATNADLPAMCKSGLFREDLLYRLNAIEVKLPPLRERVEDILPLAEFFVARHSKSLEGQLQASSVTSTVSLSEQAKQAILAHDWPGNVRELDHCMARGVFICVDGVIEAGDLGLITEQSNALDIDNMTLEEVELLMIKRALAQAKGNVSDAAKKLGLGRSSLYRRLEKFGLSG